MQGTAMLLFRRMCMLFAVTAATTLVYLLLVLLVDTVAVYAYMIWCNALWKQIILCANVCYSSTRL